MEEEKVNCSLSESSEEVHAPVHSIAKANSLHSFNSEGEEAWISIQPKANEDSFESSHKLSEIMSILINQQNKNKIISKPNDNIGRLNF